MVLSCLVEPLVSPLTGRGASGFGRRSALSKRRLLATALAASALVAVTTLVDAEEEKTEAPAPVARTVRNAHAKPAPIPARIVFAAKAIVGREDEVERPGQAPRFEWEAIHAHRLKHRRDLDRDSGPGLGQARRVDRLTESSESAFLLYASGQPRSGVPQLTIG